MASTASRPFSTARWRLRVPPRALLQRCGASVGRRDVVAAAPLTVLLALGASPGPAQAKGLKGFSAVRDTGDGYEFAYPFGWQEVNVDGVDVVYKDVIEPLESVAVQLVKTDKQSITEYGTPNELAGTLATSVLTGPRDDVQLIKSEAENVDGREYVLFEFLQKSSRFTRHVLAGTTVANGKLVLFTIGASEKRWGKLKDKLSTSLKTFKAFSVF